MICDTCGEALRVGDWPFCPHGQTGAFAEHTDDYPGGIWIENLGPHPVKVYSNTERLRIMKANGLEEFVRHVPVPGTDKSPHTTDWSRGVDAQTLENARVLVSRSAPSPEPDIADRVIQNRVNVVLTPEEASDVQRSL